MSSNLQTQTKQENEIPKEFTERLNYDDLTPKEWEEIRAHYSKKCEPCGIYPKMIWLYP